MEDGNLLSILIYPDSYGYAGPALIALDQGHFSHVYGRSFLYPSFILFTLTIGATLTTTVVSQLILWLATGLLSGGLLYFALRKMQWRNSASAIFALAYLIAYFLHRPMYLLAHAILAETFYLALVTIGVCVASWMIVRLPHFSGGQISLLVSCVVVLLIAPAFVKPHWFTGAVFTILLFATLVTLIDGRLAITLVGLATGLLVSSVILLWPELYLARTYDNHVSKIFGPKTLFCNHYPLIVPALRRGSDFERELASKLQALPKAQEWPLLGINGDACMYNADLDRFINRHTNNDTTRIAEFYRLSFLRGVFDQPTSYARKLLLQMSFALRNSLRFDAEFPLISSKQDVDAFFAKHPGQRWRFNVSNGVWLPPVPARGQSLLRMAFTLAEILFPYALSIGLLSSIMLIRVDHKAIVYCSVLFLSISAWLGHCVTVALAHTFDVARYLASVASLPLLIEALSVGTCFRAVYILCCVNRAAT